MFKKQEEGNGYWSIDVRQKEWGYKIKSEEEACAAATYVGHSVWIVLPKALKNTTTQQ